MDTPTKSYGKEDDAMVALIARETKFLAEMKNKRKKQLERKTLVECKFNLQFTNYVLTCTPKQKEKYLAVVKWWKSMNANERHQCFVRFENRGLQLKFNGANEKIGIVHIII